jgi:Domain of unknown function (DUF5658)
MGSVLARGVRPILAGMDEKHGPRLVAAILVVVMLSVLDAFLTIELIHRGAKEANPVMAYYLSLGPLVFFLVKYFLTAASILLVLIYKNVRLFGTRFQVKMILPILIIPMALTVQWEIFLFTCLK